MSRPLLISQLSLARNPLQIPISSSFRSKFSRGAYRTIKMPAKRLLSPPTSSPPPPLLTTSPSHPLPLPPFLTFNRAQIVHKFRLLAAHETTISSSPEAFVTHTPTTAPRDRYTEIRPWAHNRILLSSFEEPHDYINASPITLGRPKERFIATQGPADDAHGREGFWRMVGQEGVRVVVMLTRCVEAGREKCGVYFPLEIGDRTEIEGWGRVECVSKRMDVGSEVRELKVVKVNEEGEDEDAMTVWHYLFLAWPDMDVPKTAEDQQALLELVKATREHLKDSESPRIVHCSAGVGRTGTFIALDHLLQEFLEGKWDALADGKASDEDIDPVFDTVKKLRDQRMGLVYKVGQYAFIYQILKEKWEEKHALKAPENGEPVDGENLESPAKRRRMSQINQEYGHGGDDDDYDRNDYV